MGPSRERPTFGLTPSNDDEPTPTYCAVSDGSGGIAGYVHAETLLHGGPRARNPEEALLLNREVAGLLYEVYDTAGDLVGYWATGPNGFVDESEMRLLRSRGFQLVTAPPPLPGGEG